MKNELSELKILCVDDNAFFLDLLKILLQEIGIVNIRDAKTLETGFKLFREFQPDISIIDIELSTGDMVGIDLAKKIRAKDSKAPILFLTSYFQEDVYEMVKEIRPIAFMSKELSRLKLRQTIELAYNQIETPNKDTDQKPPPKPTPPITNHLLKSGHFFFKIGDSYKPIEVNKIDFFYAADKLTYARSDGRNYPTSVQLKVLENELYPEFLRCHKKYLINVNRIESILLREGKVKVENELLPIGYAYRKDFLSAINLLK